MIDQLTGRDSLTVIAFDHEVKVLLSSKRVLNKEEAKHRLDDIDAQGGSTDLYEAIKVGFKELREFSGENTIDKSCCSPTDAHPRQDRRRGVLQAR